MAFLPRVIDGPAACSGQSRASFNESNLARKTRPGNSHHSIRENSARQRDLYMVDALLMPIVSAMKK
jgi:hypothetical protein